MKKSVKKALTACGAAAMMLSAAQISAFADGDVKEVSEASYKSRLCLYGNSFKSDTSKQVHRKLLMYSGVYDV